MCSVLSVGDSRRLQTSSDADDEKVSVEFVAVQRSVMSDFVSTWKTSDDLSLSQVADSWHVLLTCAGVGSFFMCLFIVAHNADQKHSDEDRHTKKLENMRAEVVKGHRTHRVAASKRSARQSTRRAPSKRNRAQQEFDLIEKSLPAVLRSDSLWNKFKAEIKVYHRW